MRLYDKAIFGILNLTRNKKALNIVSKIGGIDNHNLIVPKLYLGNIYESTNQEFLVKHNINAIVNCTEKEPFDEYFNDKSTLRLSISDSRDEENILKFKYEIMKCIDFIDNCIEEDKNVYVHCYWGLMRSATVVAAYIIVKYNMTAEDAINLVREKRPLALSSLYNFSEVLDYVEKNKN